MTLKNRLVHTSMSPGPGYALSGGKPTQRLLNYLEERARGGVALICTSVGFYPSDISGEHFTAAYSEKHIPDLQKLAEVVHRHDALLAGQLLTIGPWRRNDNEPECMWGASEKVFHKGLPPRRIMSEDDIKLFITQQAASAGILKAAGFDAVEILAGIGNPISHFLSKASNNRTDRYGGNIENRCRFLVEDIQAIKKACGDDFPVLVRWSPIDYLPGGNELEDAKQIIPVLEKAGAAWLNCQVGWHESSVPLTTKMIPDGHWSFITAELKKTATVPLVTAYRYTDPLVMEQVIAAGKADIIGGARYLIGDPEFPNKAKEGRLEDIRQCICCCRCLDDVVSKGAGLEFCSVNPRLGPELDTPVKPAPKKKKVIVIGGGPAGLSAALTAAQRGHNVTIYERGPRLGGCLLMSAVFDPMYERLTNYYKTRLNKTPNIKIKLNTTVNYELVKAEKPDAVIAAVGGVPLDLDVPGIDRKNVVRSHDFLELLGGHPPQKAGLMNKVMFNAGAVALKYFYSAKLLKKMMAMKWPFGKRVAIIGGGLPGCDLALELGKHKRRIAIFEEGKRVGYDVGASDRFHSLSRLKEYAVQMEPLTKVLAITGKGVKAVRADKTEVVYEADSVAVTLGFKKNMDLVDELQGLVPEIYAIGDCAEPKRMADANKQGYRAALKI
jgi:2,4-dienoyl-CoA reductase (NADPH2)